MLPRVALCALCSVAMNSSLANVISKLNFTAQFMGCPYWPPSLQFFLPAGHGAPRLAQRKRTRPLRLPPHASGQLRCAGAQRSRGCCCARSRPRPSAQRLVLRAPMPQGAVPGCDVHVRHSCAGAQAARSHVHESLKTFISFIIE